MRIQRVSNQNTMANGNVTNKKTNDSPSFGINVTATKNFGTKTVAAIDNFAEMTVNHSEKESQFKIYSMKVMLKDFVSTLFKDMSDHNAVPGNHSTFGGEVKAKAVKFYYDDNLIAATNRLANPNKIKEAENTIRTSSIKDSRSDVTYVVTTNTGSKISGRVADVVDGASSAGKLSGELQNAEIARIKKANRKVTYN